MAAENKGFRERTERAHMNANVVKAIERLRGLSIPVLKARYLEVFGQETKTSNKQFLFRRIAWQLQAQVEGGLSERALQRAAQIADESDLRLGGPQGFWSWSKPTEIHRHAPVHGRRRDGRLPEPGTRLRRQYQDREIVVTVLEDGFEFESRQYRSLSAIAREVTGTRWNGLLFFRLTERGRG